MRLKKNTKHFSFSRFNNIEDMEIVAYKKLIVKNK